MIHHHQGTQSEELMGNQNTLPTLHGLELKTPRRREANLMTNNSGNPAKGRITQPVDNFQSLLSIGQVVREALVFNFKQLVNQMNTDSLLQSVSRLFTLLQVRNIEYVLVGGIAMLQYVEGRNTKDIDLIMALESLQQLPEIVLKSQDENFAHADFESLQIDFLLTRNPLFNLVKQEYVTTLNFMEQNIPCATVEGLLLLKLYALPSIYRQGHFARVGLYENDISTLIHYYQPNLSLLFTLLTPHLSPSDLNELHQIVADIQQRLKRFERSKCGLE